MTPLMLGSDPDRSVAFLRDVVGYGLLPGETSDVESLVGLPTSSRAMVLAWYWPQPGYDVGFDPFTDFDAALRTDRTERDLHLRLRALIGIRLGWFLRTATFATTLMLDEVVGAVCWRATCSGGRLLGVLEGTHGIDLDQIVKVAETLGLQYIDPLDEASPVSAWTTPFREKAGRVVNLVDSVVTHTFGLATREITDRHRDEKAISQFEGLLRRLSEEYYGLSVMREVAPTAAGDLEIIARARRAFEDRERLADLSRFGEVVAELTVGPDADDRDQVAELLTILLPENPSDEGGHLPGLLAWTADELASFPLDWADVDHGYGWLLMDRAGLGKRVDDALAELDSVTAARATIRKSLGSTEDLLSAARPGDTYTAPARGTRYRALYEALATTTEAVPILRIDPAEHRIQTPTGDLIDLPPSAVNDRAWWSGSGKSSTGRPQVRAWRAAGYDTPRLETNNNGLIVSAQFVALPGREEWLRAHSAEERLARGRYTVPDPPNTPLHAAFTYFGWSVWHLDDDEMTALRRTGLQHSPETERPEEDENEPHENEASSDESRIALLVDHLREYGETDRRGIEALFASKKAGLSEGLDMARWLPNLLAKASRQRHIANIGTRKQPRWVAAGSPAHLAAQLTRVLEQDERGERVTKIAAPKLAPGEPVPANLCRDVIRHAFPDITPEPPPPDAPHVGSERGELFLTEEGMQSVLAGRRLKDKGVHALLYSIQLKRDRDWEAAAEAAGAFDREPSNPELDDAIFALE